MEKILTAIIGSTVLSAVITMLYTKFFNEKNHQVKYIIEERQKWRNEIRDKLVDICTTKDLATVDKCRTFIRLRLNPNDVEDIKIINCMDNIYECMKVGSEENYLSYQEQLKYLGSILLKHDWERVKRETKFKRVSQFKLVGIIIIFSFLSQKDYNLIHPLVENTLFQALEKYYPVIEKEMVVSTVSLLVNLIISYVMINGIYRLILLIAMKCVKRGQEGGAPSVWHPICLWVSKKNNFRMTKENSSQSE
ncbi:hypothetical protein NST86_28810 [Bacillus sp. FSL L8-0199]|uniref:Uncharacterized protein n=1 Tax=Bacillus cereus TaxID=1396 RepID=A0A9X0MF62_BACCE|nr:hypothetical protein [Bacillus cereus]KXY36863.1 hypothetical protein AT268_30440 [Bacillus cereus]